MRELIQTIFLLTIVTLTSCNKEKKFAGINYFADDFENISNTNDLFPADESRWTFYQQTESGNTIEIDTINPHFGNQCIKLKAVVGNVSKSDLAINSLAFWENDIIRFSSWYNIEGTDQLGFTLLCDMEETVAVGAGPGNRIVLDETGFLIVNRAKYNKKTLYQQSGNEIPFPRNQWVELVVEMKLKQNKRGYIKLWQDGVLVIEESNIQTLPKDILYAIQGTKSGFQSLQCGITGTTSNSDLILYIDDVKIEKIN